VVVDFFIHIRWSDWRDSAERAQDCDAAVLLLDDISGIENGDFPAPDIRQVCAGEGQVGGQQPFGAAVDF
jgi:hypothetical protein